MEAEEVSILQWLLVTSAVAAQPATVCADGSCDYQLLRLALEAAETEILLLAGEHDGGVNVMLPNTHIAGETDAYGVPTATLTSPPALRPILDIRADGVRVEGIWFEITADFLSPRVGVLVDGPYSGIQLDNIVVEGGFGLFGPGGIEVHQAEVEVSNSVLRNNDGVAGGAALVDGGGSLTLSHCHVDNNIGGSGGGVAVIGADLTIDGGTFDANDALDGGHVYADSAELVIADAVMSQGTGYASGAVGLFAGTNATITGTTFTDNESGLRMFGAAIDAWQAGEVVLDQSVFTSHQHEPAVRLESLLGSATVTGSTFDANAGGALYALDVATLKMDDTWFCGNDETVLTLDLSCNAGCEIANSAFLDNRAAERGGGIWAWDTRGPLDVRSSSFIGNTAVRGSGIALDNASTATLERLVVGDHPGGPALQADQPGAYTLVEIGVFGNATDASDNLGGADLTPIDPVLTAEGNRCSTVPVWPVCSTDANGWLFEHQVGLGTEDHDGDAVPSSCDCDDTDPSVGADDECAPPGTTPTDPTGTVDITDVIGPGGIDPATTFLIGGGGCRCTGVPAAPLGWLSLVPWLVARRSRQRAAASPSTNRSSAAQ